jgi:hypothetical protein
MSVEQKDVMSALVGAAGSTSGFGLAFVGAVAALHGLSSNPQKARLNRLLKIAVVAFVVAVASTGTGFLWFVVAAALSGWSQVLAGLDVISTVSFVLSIAAIVYVLIQMAWLLRKVDLIQLTAQAAANLKSFFQ